MVQKSIGKNIQKFRKKKGLTQEQLAEMVSLSPGYLSAIERGVYQISLEPLVEIINCLECTADDLFADEIHCGYKNKASRLSDEIGSLNAGEQKKIFDVVEVMVKNAKK